MSCTGRLLVYLLAALWSCASCRGGCSSTDAIAELATAEGQVARDLAASVGDWKQANVGATFVVGDGLKTAAASAATLELTAGGRVEVDSATIIRFRDGVPGAKAPGLAVQVGNAAVFAGSEALGVATDVGLAIVEKGGALRVAASEGGFRFAVDVGRVRFEPKQGPARVLEKGDAIEVGIGAAVLEQREASSSDAGSAEAQGDATLVDGDIAVVVQGGGAAAKGPDATNWKRLAPGSTTLVARTALKLGRGTQVAVSRGGEGAALTGAGEFVLGAAPGQLVEVRAGAASLAGAARAVRIAAPGGAIVAQAGAVAQVEVKRSSTRVSVDARSVEVAGRDDRFTLGAGQSATLTNAGALTVEGQSLDYADLVLGPGQSVIVHDPRPPTAVGFSIQKVCPQGALVRLERHKREAARARAAQQPNLAVPAGSFDYHIRCVEKGMLAESDVATGKLTVVADSGTSAIARTAATTTVEVDGRTYTVLYQNRLPQISVVWSRPPSASAYTLSLVSGGVSRSFNTTAPRHTFKSGALAEGTHRLRYATSAGAKSKTTTVRIRFDNAAPKATLRTPGNGSFEPGTEVRVSGTALPGWKVSAAGQSLPVDGQYRFSAAVPTPTHQRALAVSFSHPSRGTHLYLRRSSAGSK